MGILVFGGTFNPLHIGHMFLAEELHLTYNFDPILFIPSNIPAHKETDTSISADHRLAMLRLAAELYSWMEVDDCEQRRGGVSYTIDTIREVYAKRNPEERISLLVGDDLIDGFCDWKEVDALAGMVDIVIAKRTLPGLPDFPFDHTVVDNQVLPISSSDIRRRIRNHRAYRFIVPEVIFQYIEREGIYKQSDC